MRWGCVPVICLLLSLPGAVSAHHSNASYDRDHQSKLKGTVVEFKWTNPHIQIIFEVKGADAQPQAIARRIEDLLKERRETA